MVRNTIRNMKKIGNGGKSGQKSLNVSKIELILGKIVKKYQKSVVAYIMHWNSSSLTCLL